MELDIRTIIFVTAAIQAFYALGLFLISRSWIKSPVLIVVAIAFACGSIGGFLISFRDVIHPFVSIVIANILTLGNPVFITEAVIRYQRVKSKIRLIGPVLLVIAAPILFYATFVEPSLQVRLIMMSAFFGTQTLICAYILFKRINPKLYVPTCSIMFFLVYATAIMAIRIIMTIYSTDLHRFMDAGNVRSFVQMSYIIYITGIAFTVIWLNTRKISLDLTTALHDVDRGLEDQFNFIDIISHELKTPLATIQNSIESLFMRCQDHDLAQDRAFGRIKRSLDRLDNIVDIGLKQKSLIPVQIQNKFESISISEPIQTAIEICKGAFPSIKLSLNTILLILVVIWF